MEHWAPHILVIEDDRDIRDVLTIALRTEGYRVTALNDGRQGIDYLRSARPRPDLLLLDLMMPIVCGQEVLAFVRSSAHLTTLPVVVISAQAARPPPAACAFLRKPIGLPELYATVAKYCASLNHESIDPPSDS